MNKKEESNRICEAKNCSECTQWLHNCNAECCKIIFLDIDPLKVISPYEYINIKVGKLPLSDVMYYKLRGVNYTRGFLRFKTSRLLEKDGKVMYIHPCTFLENNHCLGHPDNKPDICKSLTLETSRLPGQPFALTDNCLFKYKSTEVKK